ncbi:Ribonucleotide-diphosphate reductase subunit alpha [Lasiodiplodia theobromae]|uniref:Ribonucleotide-diphosphate reductase subunit alpha n=1 Tax=Lasiodiplodia theobromae TaxID=45133 RepID=UPI0015C305FE|nr:Ribonucleotide-diphosphate reductase subunit alpha [Lasiodiplodia theobromae]KAF4544250.1 Ribonucleotide-diphosphate reductase subunit alpha [Lasiodiplodia theobromae]
MNSRKFFKKKTLSEQEHLTDASALTPQDLASSKTKFDTNTRMDNFKPEQRAQNDNSGGVYWKTYGWRSTDLVAFEVLRKVHSKILAYGRRRTRSVGCLTPSTMWSSGLTEGDIVTN